MNKESLQNIINLLEQESSEEKAYWGIFNYGREPEESNVKANRYGLLRFATNLLKAAHASDDLLSKNQGEPVFSLSSNENWIDQDSSIILECVEITDTTEIIHSSEPYIESWQDKIMKWGCIGAFLFALISFFVGTFTIIKWLF